MKISRRALLNIAASFIFYSRRIFCATIPQSRELAPNLIIDTVSTGRIASLIKRQDTATPHSGQNQTEGADTCRSVVSLLAPKQLTIEFASTFEADPENTRNSGIAKMVEEMKQSIQKGDQAAAKDSLFQICKASSL